MSNQKKSDKMNKLTGSEIIKGFNDLRVLDFWQWAYSDMLSNAERGVFAEWLVSKALSANSGIRTEWDRYDVLTPSGIKVEVKSSGYLQSWNQSKLSKLIFGIAPTFGWDKETNVYDKECKRQADVYVFCVHNCKERENANPLDLSQWDFYVMSTAAINESFDAQKSVTLSKLLQKGARRCKYNELDNVVNAILKEETQ